MINGKGIADFVEIANRMKSYELNVRFVLVGDPDLHNPESVSILQLEEWLEKGVIEWWGHKEEMQNIYQQATIVCLPSYREGLPKSLLEAASCALPIVTYDVPGCRDIVDHKTNGLLCKVKSSEDLSRKMITMMRISQDTRNKLAKNGRKKVESFFDEKIVIKAYLKVINDIVSHEKIV